jgi:putative selenate reductase FAD-binding subunit
MSPLDYHRPKSLGEALPLLREARPLAGGTFLTPRRARLQAVVDLQDLDLDGLRVEAGHLVVGAAIKLQTLVDHGAEIPSAVVQACRHEVGLNLRNMASLGGTVVTADGRSPLATALLAAGAEAIVEPGAERLTVDAVMELRGEGMQGRLILAFLLPRLRSSAYLQVARSPMDRPVVCAAVCRVGPDEPPRVALGGMGPRPILLPVRNDNPKAAAQEAAKAYASAGDAWASAEYRSTVAGVLVGRLLERRKGGA